MARAGSIDSTWRLTRSFLAACSGENGGITASNEAAQDAQTSDEDIVCDDHAGLSKVVLRELSGTLMALGESMSLTGHDPLLPALPVELQ